MRVYVENQCVGMTDFKYGGLRNPQVFENDRKIIL